MIGFLCLAGSAPSLADDPWYGKPNDVVLGKALWTALSAMRMIGPDRINVYPFSTVRTPNKIRQVWAGSVKVEGHTGRAVVRANHTKAGATLEKVYSRPNSYLASYTVMFKAKPGYDPRNDDWFWVKYNPSGTIDRDNNGVAIAGRVDSVSGFGCAGCHRQLGGKDYEVLHGE